MLVAVRPGWVQRRVVLLRRVLAPTILLAGSVSAQAAKTIRQGLRRFRRLAGMVWARLG